MTDKITSQELIALFGETMPPEAASLLFYSEGAPIEKVRDALTAIAAKQPNSPGRKREQEKAARDERFRGWRIHRGHNEDALEQLLRDAFYGGWNANRRGPPPNMAKLAEELRHVASVWSRNKRMTTAEACELLLKTADYITQPASISEGRDE